MTPPLGSRELATFDPPPTMRADLLPTEFRSLCGECGEVTIWQIAANGDGWQATCTACGTVDSAAEADGD